MSNGDTMKRKLSGENGIEATGKQNNNLSISFIQLNPNI